MTSVPRALMILVAGPYRSGTDDAPTRSKPTCGR